jgi:hydroxyacylglutathione hydrolase
VLVLRRERRRLHGRTGCLSPSDACRTGKSRIADLFLEHARFAPSVPAMYFRQLLNDDSACASYLFGCKTHGQFAVVDPHADLVGEYIALAEGQGTPIVAVFETHVQADHVSGLPDLVRRTGATAYLPEGAGVAFEHHALADGEVVKLGNTEVQTVATPGHALAHHAYLVTDRTRGDEPWFVLTGDALLVGDAGRPDLHAGGEHSADDMARTLYRSLTNRLLALPDHLALYPAHFSGSVCGRGLSANPVSTIGFERRHNRALQVDSEDAFVAALLEDTPPAPDKQADIVAANRAGRPLAAAS